MRHLDAYRVAVRSALRRLAGGTRAFTTVTPHPDIGPVRQGSPRGRLTLRRQSFR
jgi:hypothetical protein